jgi:hypothetical protein
MKSEFPKAEEAGTVHRTRAIGRTVNVTYEKQGAQTVFVEPMGNDE